MKKLMLLVLTVAPVAFGSHAGTKPGEKGQLKYKGAPMHLSTHCKEATDQLETYTNKLNKAYNSLKKTVDAKDSKKRTIDKMAKNYENAYNTHKAVTANKHRVCGREAAAKRGYKK